jgi:hypothetical protein
MNDRTRQLNLDGDVKALAKVVAFSVNTNLHFRGRWQEQPTVTMPWPLPQDETVPCIQAALETEAGQNAISRSPTSLQEHCQVLLALCLALPEVDVTGAMMRSHLEAAFASLSSNYSLDFGTTGVVYISVRFAETT